MKALFTGGVKSGKSQLAEAYTLALSPTEKPYYLATTECLDEEMQQRILLHQQRRGEQFVTLESPLAILPIIKACDRPVLIECVTMWLNNMLYHKKEADIFPLLEQICQLPQDLVFVHNEVGFGILPNNPLARTFVDISGKAGQLLAQYCDEVYFCSVGLQQKIK